MRPCIFKSYLLSLCNSNYLQTHYNNNLLFISKKKKIYYYNDKKNDAPKMEGYRMPTKSTGGKTATGRKARHSWIQNFLNIKNFQNFIFF